MSDRTPPKVVLGMGLFANDAALGKQTELQEELLDVCAAYGVKDLDTSIVYAGSETLLGNAGAAEQFRIHTKAMGFVKGCLRRQSIFDAMENSLKSLKTDCVDTYFFHSPDPSTPITESLDAIQHLYEQKKLKHFGVSNYLPHEVEEIHAYCKSKGYVLPTRYQGSYNPFARHAEDELLPVLRKLDIGFIAYSPIAGGFLARTADSFRSANNDKGRWKKGTFSASLYNSLYNKPELLDALEKWEQIADAEGIAKAELAYRWVAQNLDGSKGDGLLFGVSSVEQLENTLDTLEEGPLTSETTARLDALWGSIKHVAPYDNYHGVKK